MTLLIYSFSDLRFIYGQLRYLAGKYILKCLQFCLHLLDLLLHGRATLFKLRIITAHFFLGV